MSKFAAFLIFLSILIVIGVAIYITNPMKKIAQNNDKKRIADLALIKQAVDDYYKTYGVYPSYDKDKYEILSLDKEIIPWGAPFLPFLERLPQESSSSRRYIYWVDERNGNKTFKIYASLEDPGSVENACGDKDCPNVPDHNLCGDNMPCNYGVTSGNVSP